MAGCLPDAKSKLVQDLSKSEEVPLGVEASGFRAHTHFCVCVYVHMLLCMYSCLCRTCAPRGLRYRV